MDGSVRVSGNIIAERLDAVDLTHSSMAIELKAVTDALLFLKEHNHKNAVIVTDSMRTLQNVNGGHFYADWIGSIVDSQHLSVN